MNKLYILCTVLFISVLGLSYLLYQNNIKHEYLYNNKPTMQISGGKGSYIIEIADNEDNLISTLSADEIFFVSEHVISVKYVDENNNNFMLTITLPSDHTFQISKKSFQ